MVAGCQVLGVVGRGEGEGKVVGKRGMEPRWKAVKASDFGGLRSIFVGLPWQICCREKGEVGGG